MQNQHYDRERQNQVAHEKVFSVRKYSPLVVVCEVFLRRQMGRNYFSFRIFLGGLFVLIMLRIIMNFNAALYSYQNAVFPPLHPFDFIILAYIIVGIAQLISIGSRNIRTETIHSYDIGTPNLLFLGKFLLRLINFILSIPRYIIGFFTNRNSPAYRTYFRDYIKLTYLFVEPFSIVLMSIVFTLFTQSLIVGFFTLYAGFRVFWHNYKVFKLDENELIIILDSKKQSQKRSGEIQHNPVKARQRNQREKPQRKTQPSKTIKRQVPQNEETNIPPLDEFFKNYGKKQ